MAIAQLNEYIKSKHNRNMYLWVWLFSIYIEQIITIICTMTDAISRPEIYRLNSELNHLRWSVRQVANANWHNFDVHCVSFTIYRYCNEINLK